MRSSQLFTLIVVVLLIATSPVLVGGSNKQSGNPCNGAEKKIVVDKDPTFNSHVKYTFQFSPEKNQYCVLVANKGEHKTASAFEQPWMIGLLRLKCRHFSPVSRNS